MGGRGDVSLPRYHIEVKTTQTKRYRVAEKLLDKTERRAIKEDKEPAVVVNVRGKRWVAVTYWQRWKLFKRKALAAFRAAAKKDGVTLRKERSLRGGPWELIPFIVFERIVKGGKA